MRIDEFSNASSIDCAISTTEQTQFLLFGFDISLAAPVELFYEQIIFVSKITKFINIDSLLTTASETFAFISRIVKQFNFNSKLDK